MDQNEQSDKEYRELEAEKFKRDLPYTLIVKFESKQMMELFVSTLSNSCEQHMYDQALEECNLHPDFVYLDENQKWLGDSTVRVFEWPQ